MPVDYHVVWDAVLERTLSKTMPKVTNSWKTVLSTVRNDFLHKFINKATASFSNRLRSCGAATGRQWHCKHSVKYIVSFWHLTFIISLKRLNCWWKVVQDLICYSWIFNLQMRVHLIVFIGAPCTLTSYNSKNVVLPLLLFIFSIQLLGKYTLISESTGLFFTKFQHQ